MDGTTSAPRSKSSAEKFNERLAFGRIGESRIAEWLKRARGYSIISVYEIEQDDGKGPRLHTPGGDLVSPDILAYKDKTVFWIEAKHKTVFTFYRKHGLWTTGIDLHHYKQYREVAKKSPWPIWILFLHTESEPPLADRNPNNPDEKSPVGLYGGELWYLTQNEDHQWKSDGRSYGRHGMVYWAEPKLNKLATLAEVEKL
jgi:hypothetical protein